MPKGVGYVRFQATVLPRMLGGGGERMIGWSDLTDYGQGVMSGIGLLILLAVLCYG